jgi:hypothetical protein
VWYDPKKDINVKIITISIKHLLWSNHVVQYSNDANVRMFIHDMFGGIQQLVKRVF